MTHCGEGTAATKQLLDVFSIETDTTAAGFSPVPALIVGVILAALVGAVIIGGIKSIARVTEKVVPFMAALYLVACIVVILGSASQVPDAFGAMFSGAFTGEGVAGGVLGALIVGFQRAAFSNEAGIGSASIAHSAVKTDEPATEGFVALLEPFIDTIVICTMTALTITITGVYLDEGFTGDGVQLTSAAFATVLPWFPTVLAVAVVLFALSTMLSWSYYGMKATGYLFGDSKVAENIFKIVFCVFTVIGAVTAMDSVLGFSDAAIFLMSIPNVIGMYLLAGVVRREIVQYREKIRSGQIQRVK